MFDGLRITEGTLSWFMCCEGVQEVQRLVVVNVSKMKMADSSIADKTPISILMYKKGGNPLKPPDQNCKESDITKMAAPVVD